MPAEVEIAGIWRKKKKKVEIAHVKAVGSTVTTAYYYATWGTLRKTQEEGQPVLHVFRSVIGIKYEINI